jgi:hypothetical protein
VTAEELGDRNSNHILVILWELGGRHELILSACFRGSQTDVHARCMKARGGEGGVEIE